VSSPITIAVYPSAPEALPALERALSGEGRPVGVTGVRRGSDNSLVVEFDSARTRVRLLMAVIDSELHRYNATRRTQLLSELSLEQMTHIASEELQAPEIAPDTVLEALLAKAGFGEV
jgi:hypothetical protein